jgi:ATP-dependent Clp protease ATP-binding subunit ClpC
MRRKVDFKNTVLIMTSNIGSRQIRSGGGLGFVQADDGAAYEKMKSTVLDEAKRMFNPEFLNRVDEMIVFKSLEKSHMEEIIRILMSDVERRLADSDMELVVAQDAIDLLVETGFDASLGARPLRRAIQRLVEDPLAVLMLQDQFHKGSRIAVRRAGDELAFEEASKAKGGARAKEAGETEEVKKSN